MNKRLTCLLLCLVMLLSVFLASCAEETDEDVQNKIEEAAAKDTVTLTMWVVSEDKVSDEVAAAVTKELSTLTEAKYKARLNIKYYTEDEYYAAVKENMEAYNKYLIENNVDLDATEAVETDEEGNPIVDNKAEVETDASGMLRDKYPELLPNQVDIIYIGDVKEKNGEALFNELVANDSLAALDAELNASSKKLREYLSPTLLSAVQKNGATYAIPNNNIIGEYTFMLLNRELSDVLFSGYIRNGKIDSLFNEYVYSFLDQIKTTTDSSVLPIDASYEECLTYLAHYWSINPDSYAVNGMDFSVFGSLYEELDALSRGSVSFDVDSLFANPDFVKDYLKINSYRLNDEGRDFFRSEANEGTVYEKTAIKFVTGDLTVVNEVIDEKTGETVLYYDDADGTRYYAVPVKFPSATTEDIYSNMFGVYKRSVDVSRCMEIITYINTNIEARNILQYGVLEEHYELVEREVENLAAGEKSYFAQPKVGKNGKKLYNMDVYATGNAFLSYLTADMNENVWEKGKDQNLQSLVDPLLSFDLADYAASSGKICNNISLPDLSGANGEKLSYTLEYSSGYNKDVLSQNKNIGEWIAACDKLEKGVFIYKTYTENKTAQKMEGIFYVYNTLGEGEFSVVATPTTEPVYLQDGSIKVDENGKEVHNEIAMDLCMTYTSAKNSGYTLSVINYTGTINATYQNTVSASVNGTAVEASKVSEKLQAYVTEFDLTNTTHYTIDIYGDLYASHFGENAKATEILNEWILSGSCHNVMQWKDTDGDKNVYTYMVFRGDLKAATVLDVQIRGDEKNVLLSLDYTSVGNDDAGAPLAGIADLYVDGKSAGNYKSESYLLYYIVITADKDVTVELSATADTLEDDQDRAALPFELIENDDLDSCMDVYGELNTELVSYMETLSAKVEAILDACTTYEELSAVVADLGILLGEATPDQSKLKTDAVKALAKEYTVNNKLDAFHEQILHITNYKTLAELANSSDSEEEGGSTTAVKSGEKRYYYLSPYGVYYQWMKEFSYLPAENAQ